MTKGKRVLIIVGDLVRIVECLKLAVTGYLVTSSSPSNQTSSQSGASNTRHPGGSAK
ncbi:hypothetical protein BLAT2472_20082 [Burkholderia latens]